MHQILTAVYAHNERTWQSRNAVLHSPANSLVADIRSTEGAEIKQIYQNPESLSLSDRHMCDRSLESLLGGPAATRRRWLRRAKRSIARRRTEEASQALITKFFVRRENG